MSNVIQHLYKFSASQGAVLYAWFPSMHTRVDIVLCSRQGEEALMLVVGAVYEMLRSLEKMGNYYDADSELARLNRTAAVCPQPVSPELYDMLAFCVDCHARTGGCFDVTVHSANYTTHSIRNVQLSPQEHTLHFLQPGLTINLSGFLKGYALEKIRELLQHYGVENALANMGNSSVLALGHHPLADGWKVDFGQIAASQPGERPELLLQNECLTTSGNDSNERKHIINPQTGELVEGKRGVAVVTADGSVGEVLSTALFVADAHQRKALEAEFRPRLILDL
ncbi:FAD:protein FMN transferase [Bacteroides sp. UBA939]|uniref:FAD:protein FMN transferase n=1 Tax=Bacteroides sp. UBA939 TaxID=1946092 RepID=UPI0025C35CD2|nr:FAD:protein FMN transferase [Bacteroides sp. UBA939]